MILVHRPAFPSATRHGDPAAIIQEQWIVDAYERGDGYTGAWDLKTQFTHSSVKVVTDVSELPKIGMVYLEGQDPTTDAANNWRAVALKEWNGSTMTVEQSGTVDEDNTTQGNFHNVTNKQEKLVVHDAE